jgi:hypothetical protein
MKAKTNTIKIFITSLVCAAILLSAHPVFAQSLVFCGRSTDTGDYKECKFEHLFELIYRISNYMIGMAGFVAIFFIVWGGVQMLLSGGNTSKVQEAKSTVWHAVLGLILTLLAYLIVGYVAGLLLPGGGGGDPLRSLMDYLSP